MDRAEIVTRKKCIRLWCEEHGYTDADLVPLPVMFKMMAQTNRREAMTPVMKSQFDDANRQAWQEILEEGLFPDGWEKMSP